MNHGQKGYAQHLPFLAHFLTETLYLPPDKRFSDTTSQAFHGHSEGAPEAASSTEDQPGQQGNSQPVTAREPSAFYQQVAENETETTKAEKPPCYGDFQRSVLILVTYEANTTLIPKDRLVLNNILQAVGLTFSDVAVVNVSWQTGLTYLNIRHSYPPRQVIGFGLPEAWLPGQPSPYTLANLSGGESILIADALADIACDKKRKKSLWQGLQALFQ